MSDQTYQFKHLRVDELKEGFLAAAEADQGDAFLNSFECVSQLFRGDYSASLSSGIDLLNRCLGIDAAAYAKIHKGMPYYWLAMAAFMIHDYQTPVFFFDAAMSEDLRLGSDPTHNPAPAPRFIRLQGEVLQQAAGPLVRDTQARIERSIRDYKSATYRLQGAQDFDMKALRSKFLTPALRKGNERFRSMATIFISFFLEWDYRNTFLDLRAAPGTSEPFFIHLFKGCVLLESILRAAVTDPPPNTGWNLGKLLQHLHCRLGIPHNIRIGDADFPEIADEALDAKLDIHTSVVFTGRLRNSVGHYLAWDAPMTKLQYQQLFRMIAVSNSHAIATLY